jgi:hypothetical protein
MNATKTSKNIFFMALFFSAKIQKKNEKTKKITLTKKKPKKPPRLIIALSTFYKIFKKYFQKSLHISKTFCNFAVPNFSGRPDFGGRIEFLDIM